MLVVVRLLIYRSTERTTSAKLSRRPSLRSANGPETARYSRLRQARNCRPVFAGGGLTLVFFELSRRSDLLATVPYPKLHEPLLLVKGNGADLRDPFESA